MACEEVQGSILASVYRTDDLQFFVLLVSFVTSPWKIISGIGFQKTSALYTLVSPDLSAGFGVTC